MTADAFSPDSARTPFGVSATVLLETVSDWVLGCGLATTAVDGNPREFSGGGMLAGTVGAEFARAALGKENPPLTAV